MGGRMTNAVAVDRYGDVVVTGWFMGATDLGGGTITANTVSVNSLFLAKYSGVDGSYRWARGFGASSADAGCGITTDPKTGNVVVTGAFMGAADFGNGTPVSSPGQALFLAGYGPSGNFLWLTSYGGGARV